MTAFPESAKAPSVVGAGIVGNSLVHHLARLGWRDLVLLDKGPLPNPGGSTGHASNFIFPVDHSKEITALTRDSVNQYIELGVYTVSGGIEVARSAERFQELNRRLTSSISWGEPSELLTPARVKGSCRTSTRRSSSAASTRRESAWSTRSAPGRGCARPHRHSTR